MSGQQAKEQQAAQGAVVGVIVADIAGGDYFLTHATVAMRGGCQVMSRDATGQGEDRWFARRLVQPHQGLEGASAGPRCVEPLAAPRFGVRRIIGIGNPAPRSQSRWIETAIRLENAIKGLHQLQRGLARPWVPPPADQSAVGQKRFPEIVRIDSGRVHEPRNVRPVHQQAIGIVGQPLQVPQ